MTWICPRRERSFVLALFAVSFFLLSCGDDLQSNTGSARIATAEEALEEVTRVTPWQNDEAVIVRVSGLVYGSDDSFRRSDVSEGYVKWYHADGRLRAVIGRKGEGPGEFDSPRFPRFGRDGRIIIADQRGARLTLFDPERLDTVPSTITLSEVTRLTGFGILPDGRFVSTGRFGDPTENHAVLAVHDSNGQIVSSHLEIGRLVPAGAKPHDLWDWWREFTLGIDGTTAYVVSNISDSLWTVDLRTGNVLREEIPIPGYLRPQLPETPPTNIQEIMKWTSQYHTATPPIVFDGGIAIPFVKGILNYGDPNITMIRNKNGAWLAVENMKPIVGSAGDALTSLANPNADTVVFAMLRMK